MKESERGEFKQTFILIRSSGEWSRVELERDAWATFVDERKRFNDQVHELLSCDCYKHVSFGIPYGMLVGESGKICTPQKELNVLASLVLAPYVQVIVGDALLVKTGYLTEEDEEFSYIGFREDELRAMEVFLENTKNLFQNSNKRTRTTKKKKQIIQ